MDQSVLDARQGHGEEGAQAAGAQGTMARASGIGSLTGGASQPPQPPQVAPVALGNGEAPAMQFMPYPGGTGALMERVVREKGIRLE